jgi:hypothetical protein
LTATIHEFPGRRPDQDESSEKLLYSVVPKSKLPPEQAAEAVAICVMNAAIQEFATFGFSVDPFKEKLHAQDMAFFEDSIRAMIYRYYGFEHRFHPMIEEKVKFKHGKYADDRDRPA